MSTIIFVVMVVVAALLFAMWWSPGFRETVTTSWGVAGAALAAVLAWTLTWFAGAPPTVPPM